ncbi:MAG: hypothetical protein BGO95_10695 [Micrococcales bacterium 73-13]|nr:MAG: hypothetical protein BGO95_10695 [Micrococcales bacterium 73-13]
MRIQITGYPLPAPVIIHDPAPDAFMRAGHWLLDHEDAARLLTAWRDALTDEADVRREWAYSESGLFATALYLDGELSVALWESATGSDGTDVYSTATIPFDFEVRLLDDIGPSEDFRDTRGAR